jgi:putative transposase
MTKYKTPDGKVVKGWVVALDPTPEQADKFRRDCGARRFAYNWAVAQIKTSFDTGKTTGQYDPTVWSAYGLRKRWNTVKADTAPWWAENSKEAYANGIADATTSLKNWHDSKTGKRKGRRVGFPRFKKKTKDRARCQYTTGALRVTGPRTVVLPGVGTVATAENLRPLWRHIRRGTGRVMTATVRNKAGRWLVSLQLEIDAPHRPEPRTGTVGADVGIGDHLLIVMAPDGQPVEKVPNPRALRSTLKDLRKTNRALSRKVEGSTRWKKTARRLARLHGRAAQVRSDVLQKATSHLAKTHGQVVIEDLAPVQHQRGLRAHRKSWTDAAAGEFRRQLTYKTAWYGSVLWVADRWYPSSKTCSTCQAVNAGLTMSDRQWACPDCGTLHDRDENAGVNLARLPASWAEAPSDDQTAPGRHVAVKRVNHPGRVAA